MPGRMSAVWDDVKADGRGPGHEELRWAVVWKRHGWIAIKVGSAAGCGGAGHGEVR